MNNQNEDLVIYSSIERDSSRNKTYKVLNTLSLVNLSKNELLTIGYCEIDLKDNRIGNIIAMVEKSDSKKMFVKNKKAWIANPRSRKIELLNNLENIIYFNEFYDGKDIKIDYELLKQ